MAIGISSFTCGVIIGLRFLFHYLAGHGSGMIQSLILSSVLLGLGFQTMLVALIADLLSVNRKMMEDLRYKVSLLTQSIEYNDSRNHKTRRA
jgi:hypothetical protein